MDIQRVLVTQEVFTQTQRELMKQHIYFIAGHSSLFIPSERKKIMLSHRCRPWPDINGELVEMSGGEAARVEMNRAFPDLKRVGWFSSQVKWFDWRQPMYFRGPLQGEFEYIDLVGAYHQIYQWLWLDTPYPRGYGKRSLKPVADRLQHWKPARNAVIGICRTRKTAAYKNGKRIEISTSNKFLSPGLWATVQSVLHEVSYIAITLGCVYLNTDGFVLPVGEGSNAFKAFLYKSGFDFRVDGSGEGDIRGWNSYSIGKKETALYKTGQKGGQVSINNIRPATGFVQYLERCRYYVQRGGIDSKR